MAAILIPSVSHAGDQDTPRWELPAMRQSGQSYWADVTTARSANTSVRNRTNRQVSAQPRAHNPRTGHTSVGHTSAGHTSAPGSPTAISEKVASPPGVVTRIAVPRQSAAVQLAQLEQPVAKPPTPASSPTSPPAAGRLNPTGRTINIVVPVVDSQTALGEVSLTLGGDDSLRIGTEPLLAAITPLLDPRAVERLRGQIAGRRDLLAAEWAELGYPLVYDPARIELKITIPAADRVSKRLEVASVEDERQGTFETRAKVSGVVNVRGSVDYVHQGVLSGLGDPNFVIDGALRVGTIVFETEANVGPGADGDLQFQREGSRFVFDDTQRTMRWAVGDVRGQSSGFSSTGDVLGVSVFRSYSELAPQRFVRPRGEREFVLNRASSVEAIVNGRSVRKIRLDPGTYKLSDFPFIEGSNDVRLLIEDDTGLREAINFNLFFDRALLSPGLTEFSLTAGQTSVLEAAGPNYTEGEWVVGGFIRRGFSDRLTAGANMQLQQSGQLVGAEALMATSIGTFGIDAAASNVDGFGSGAALTLVYSRLIAINGGRSQNLGITVESRTENFAAPGSRGAANPYSVIVGAAYSRSFGEFSYGGLDLRYSVGRDNRADQSSVRATFGRRVGAAGNLTLDADWRDDGIETDFGVRVAFTWRFGNQSSIRSEYNSRDESVRLSYQRQRGQGVGSYNISADIDRSSDRVGANLAVGYIANRADLGYALTTAYDTQTSRINDQRSSVRFGTSLAFADGAFALGRPVSDSFAIVTPHSSLKGASILVEPRPEGFTSRSGALGGAVYSDLAAYSDRSIAVDVPGAPSGYDLGAGTYRVRPAYRSGYKFEVGSDYSVTVIGRLLDRDGQAISLLAGSATEVAKPDGPKVTVFTNREGRFALSGVRAGRWIIEMPTSPPTRYEISVPETADGIVRMGNVEAK